MSKEKFNVLMFDFCGKKIKPYNVLPYFRDCWKDKFNKEEKAKIKEAKTENKKKELLKEWIKGRSLYMFKAKCEWEFLVASWPFGSKKITDELKVFLSGNYNLDDYCDSIDFYNIIMGDMEKIDVHTQIMFNIDIITNILYKEFFKKKR